jgi:hypothetical protein
LEFDFFGFSDLCFTPLLFARCCGGDFATTSTARSNRSHALGSSSISGLFFESFGADMALSDDPWIAENSTIDPERLHALGMITLWWNHCERNLFHIFHVVFNLRPKVAWVIAHDIGDMSLCEKIKEMLKIKSPDDDVAEVLTYYLKAYDACRINRNTLTHFTGSISRAAPDDLSKITFVRMKGPSGQQNPLPSSLEDIRRVAHETRVFALHSWKLYKALAARAEGKQASLPPPIAPPEPLWKPPPPTVPKPRRLPLPSQGSRTRRK